MPGRPNPSLCPVCRGAKAETINFITNGSNAFTVVWRIVLLLTSLAIAGMFPFGFLF